MGEALLLSLTFLAAWLAIGTELLSALQALTPPGVIWFWLISLFLGGAGLFFRFKAGQMRSAAQTERIFSWGRLDQTSRLWLIVLISIAAVLLVVAYLSPPNTNDSLAYHMPRVLSWAQQASLDNYPTPIPRQLWMPPFAEWAVLHLYLLGGSDRLANLPQWLAMVGSLLACALLAVRMNEKHPHRAGILAAVFCATLPMGALQATSNQTDYVAAFWLICLAYWVVLAHQRYPNGKRLTRLQFAGLACAAGLGMLSKGTFYPFAAPWLVWLLVSMLRPSFPTSPWKTRLSAILRSLSLSLVLIFLLNLGTWMRNQQAYGFPLGPRDGMRFLSNEIINPSVLLSNLLRNSTLHLATPYGVINGPLRQAVEIVHAWIGLDASDPRTSLDDYRVKRSLQEDYAGNFWHFILTGLSMLVVGWRFFDPQNRKRQTNAAEPALDRHVLVAYALALLGGFLLFSALFKWQATGSRLHLPLFVLAAPLVGCLFAQPLELLSASFRLKRPAWGAQKAQSLAFSTLAALLLLVGYRSILSNPSRPLIVDQASAVEASILVAPRSELLFANSPEMAPTYFSLANAIALLDSCAHFGLILDSHDAPYPFWALQHPLYELPTARPITWLYLNDTSGEIVLPPLDAKICAIVCTLCSQPELEIDQLGHFTAESTHPGGFILYRLRADD
jgi:hypothetical protein